MEEMSAEVIYDIWDVVKDHIPKRIGAKILEEIIDVFVDHGFQIVDAEKLLGSDKTFDKVAEEMLVEDLPEEFYEDDDLLYNNEEY